MTQDGLNYREVIVQPAPEGIYRMRETYTTHAPTSGPVLLHMLNMLERYESSAEDGLTNLQRLIEITKCKYKNSVSSGKT